MIGISRPHTMRPHLGPSVRNEISHDTVRLPPMHCPHDRRPSRILPLPLSGQTADSTSQHYASSSSSLSSGVTSQPVVTPSAISAQSAKYPGVVGGTRTWPRSPTELRIPISPTENLSLSAEQHTPHHPHSQGHGSLHPNTQQHYQAAEYSQHYIQLQETPRSYSHQNSHIPPATCFIPGPRPGKTEPAKVVKERRRRGHQKCGTDRLRLLVPGCDGDVRINTKAIVLDKTGDHIDRLHKMIRALRHALATASSDCLGVNLAGGSDEARHILGLLAALDDEVPERSPNASPSPEREASPVSLRRHASSSSSYLHF